MLRVVVEVGVARGHLNVKCTHRSTLEVTSEDYLTPRGDCILGVSFNLPPCKLSEEFKEVARSRDTKILAVILAGKYYDLIVGRGDERMTFTSCSRMVFRKSTFIAGDTVMVEASKAARDIDRRIVEFMRDPKSTLTLVLIAISP